MDSVVPTLTALTMTLANTEYSVALPANTYRVNLKCRDGTLFRIAFATGKVATPTDPYLSIIANTELLIELPPNRTTVTLYAGCGSAAKVVEIMSWARSA